MLQDMVNSFIIQKVDLHKVRNDPNKALFDLTDCVGPDCARALEQNYLWVIELTATLSGADPWPPHRSFKAGHQLKSCMLHSAVLCSACALFQTCMYFLQRISSTNWRSSMVSFQKGPPKE